MVFISEIVVRSRSAQIRKGLLVEDVEEVRQWYFSVPCFIDVVSTLSLLVYYFPSWNAQYLGLLFFLKVANLVYYDRCFNWVLGVSSRKVAVYELVKAALYLFYFSHLSACIFFVVDYVYYAEKGL